MQQSLTRGIKDWFWLRGTREICVFQNEISNCICFRTFKVDGKFKLCPLAPVAVTFSSCWAVTTPEILQQIDREPAAKNDGRQWPRRSSRRETENIQISILFQTSNK